MLLVGIDCVVIADDGRLVGIDAIDEDIVVWLVAVTTVDVGISFAFAFAWITREEIPP